MNTWPFPPPGGPTPITPEQERAYQRQQRDNWDEAPWLT